MTIPDPSWPTAASWLARGDPEPGLAVVGVPTSAASLSPSRAYLTPGRLRGILDRFSTLDGERDVDLDGLPVTDLGDWPVAGLEASGALAAVDEAARHLEPGPVYAFIGGDDAITAPLVRGLGGPEGAGLLTLDAHHDVRSLEDGLTNGNPVRALIEHGLAGTRIAQVGIHSFANSAEYRRYCDRQGVAIFTMQTVDDWGIEDTINAALDRLGRESDWVYVDVDLDVLDRAFAPGCPGSRPGGMTPRQLATAARLCGRHARVRAAGFVEVDAAADPGDLTLMNLATAFLAFAAGVADRRRGERP